MVELEKSLSKTCFYRCTNGKWVLNGGGAPPGFFCEQINGTCTSEGEIAPMAPKPILPPDPFMSTEPKPISSVQSRAKLVGSNSAAYQYDLVSDSLYFSEGQAEPGYVFFSKISVAELWDRFPSIAREVDLIKQAKSISSFSIEIPAVAIAHETK